MAAKANFVILLGIILPDFERQQNRNSLAFNRRGSQTVLRLNICNYEKFLNLVHSTVRIVVQSIVCDFFLHRNILGERSLRIALFKGFFACRLVEKNHYQRKAQF